MSRRTLNLANVYMIERIGPDYGNFHFKLKFWGITPDGNDLNIIIDFPAWGVEHLAQKLHEVQKEHERLLAVCRHMLETGS